MNNLFSIFEPQALSGIPMNWVSAWTLLTLTPVCFWSSSNHTLLTWKMLMSQIYKEFSLIWGTLSNPGVSLLTCGCFLYLILNNGLGLLPYVFTASSHLTFTASLALPLWIGHMISSVWSNVNHALAHLVPLGSPMALSPFMVLIELVSSVIRPLTLSVRLAANMVAGHLLLCLISDPGNISSANLAIILLFLILLLTLEVSVALIQGYVFSVLSTLYMSEVNSGKLD